MPPVNFLTITQQVAKHLRAEIELGRWADAMPGRAQLAAELGVNHQTVVDALRQLEREGLLVAQGLGRSRRIARLPDGKAKPLRVALLVWSPADRAWTYVVDLQHRLGEAGHIAFHTAKSLTELKMDVGRIARLVNQIDADAWVVGSASAEVLAWFARQKKPAFAFFGGWRGLPIAAVGVNNQSAMVQATRGLLELGHRRIVMLIRRQHRKPEPAPLVRAFLDTLEVHGIPNSTFSLPDWNETVPGFQNCLKALFQVTPPTAIIVDEPELFVATNQFLSVRGLRVPQDVSLVYQGHEPVFDWCVPTMAHIRADLTPLVRHILRWANQVSGGKRDLRQHLLAAKYIPGGSVATRRKP